MKIFDIIFREKPSMMLVALINSTEDIYASTLAKTIDCTYSHVVKLLADMEKAGLLTYKKQGRLKILTLTAKGQEVARGIENIRTALSRK